MSALRLDPWVQALRASIARTDAEAVHDLRVATRRIDTFLRMAGTRVLRDDLRWLRQAAGPARDLDVLCGRPWPEPTRRLLDERRLCAHADLAHALATPRAGALLTALAGVPPLPRAKARAAFPPMLRRLRTLRVDPADPEQVHRRRRLLRRVRYAAELLHRPTDPLVRLQDALGALSDSCLLHRALPEAASPAALQDALRAADAAWTRYAPRLKDLE